MREWSEEAWNRIDDLLDEALDRSPEDRTTFLNRACADEPELRRQVEALIEAEEAAPNFLESGAAAFLTGAASRPADEDERGRAGRRVGAYRLIEEIGRGGMSRVYRAERVDGAFEQQVAVKLLPVGLDTPEARQRFRIERQVLADLEHPHIARLLDGGVTDDDVPYLVMEHVDGQPITAYCDTYRLSVRDRLALLIDVGEALQYAHRNLIVHRDLKPSNILVTEEEQVKLLDFGIAKLLGAQIGGGMESLTHTGIRPMTPAYAAPEQVRGESISAATDVYQFGILAYEVLTAHRPFESHAGSPFERERAVVEESPPRPSTVVATEVERTTAGTTERITPETVGAARSTSADQLHDQFQGDVDAMLMKALRKAPGQRYASAEAFVADIERYFDERPVEARSITPAYRLRKFIQRHQAGVAASASFVVLIVGFVVTLLWQQRQMAQQRDRAQQEAQKAEEVSTFLMNLFEANDPSAAKGDTITARELLRRGLRRAEALEDQPAVRAQMLNVIGGIHRKQGQYPKAESLFSEALSLRRQTDARRIDIASSLSNLGHVRYLRGEDRDADSLLREALRIQQAALPAHRAERAEMLTRHGLALHDLGKYEQSERRHREALRLFRAVHDSPHPDVAQALNNLAMVLHDQDRLKEAEQLYRKTLAMQNELLSAPHPDIAGTINNMGYVLRAQDEHARAEDRFRRVLRMDRALYDGTHPYLAYDHHNVARAMMQRGQHADAIPLLRQSASICREHLPDTRRLLISTHQRLGRSLIAVEEYARAESSLQKALNLQREEGRLNDENGRTILDDFVQLYEAWGKPQQGADVRKRLAEMEGTAS